uniref:Uncharacterized protein n=1 Tax=Nelumbo nucifera TaxID=4432 RepID=A0A822ZHW8_NELNU|nr:TPA_asm: hypothetical protein HUJ06_003934 [Nelumbo nucifera]
MGKMNSICFFFLIIVFIIGMENELCFTKFIGKTETIVTWMITTNLAIPKFTH